MSNRLKLQGFLFALISVVLFSGCSSQPQATTEDRATPTSRLSSPDDVDLERGLGGWGPARATFTNDQPADHPTFNSIIGSRYGDTRNFLQLKDKNASDSAYTDRLEGTPGNTYTALVWYENSASPSIKTPAKNVNLRIQAPATITGAAEISALISADNSDPKVVWDGAVIHLSDPKAAVALRYIPGSAQVRSTGKVDGQKLPESLFESGTKLGCDSLDGVIDGTAKCAGWVTFDFLLAQPNFTVTALVASSKDPTYAPSTDVRVGDTVTVRAEYKNTGSTQQDDVVLRVFSLPAGFQLVDGPVLMSTARTNGYVALSPGAAARIGGRGVNIGSYAPGGSNCFIKFSVRIADVPGHDFARDGQVYTYPVVTAETDNGTKHSGVKILVFGPQQ